ncbi:hypothetical protein DCC85_11620 [Paenibacillus sp. CAA11]|uniref:sensor histidine kinase n=1 Tax=Paenibacillus sp. CAA11 TaxID=1532905 RepID=UPI000D3AEC89|nr:sensor histidine kinase [Paenibacillus sp. CAA11]AWB44803.1 hypothetical protein DCC85_11620 [Paenibacillus sp. CAA11]
MTRERSLSQYWNNLRLKNKLMILYFTAVFFPILLTNTVFYHMTAQNVRNEKMKDLKQALENNKDNFRKILDGIISFSTVIYTDGPLYSALDQTYSSPEDVLTAYNDVLIRSINRFVPLNKQFYNAYLYTDNKTLPSSGMLNSINEQTLQQNWYKAAMDPARSRKWTIYTHSSDEVRSGAAIQRSQSPSTYVSLIRELDFYQLYSNYRKILKIDVLPGYLQNTLFDRSFPGELYLINPRGEVVYTSVESPPDQLEVSVTKGHTSITSPYEGVDYLQGWKMVGVYPDRVMGQSLFESRKFIVLLTCANLLFPSLIILAISQSLNSRLGLLLKGIRRVQNQRFEQLNTPRANDEIGQLTEEFNRMTLRIDGLIQDVYIAELDRRQAQFNALQSQINPHYLYNTLDAIRMSCITKGEHETATMIKLLGRGFRRSLSWGQDFIPIEEELEFVVDYLEIQQFRFGSKLTYELNLDEQAADERIPKMSILPLVENACIHGIEHLETPGFIRISVTHTEQWVLISIQDDGIGMNGARLATLNEQLIHPSYNQEGKHVGLKNVYDRLKWQFGSNFNMSINSQEHVGTEIELWIPHSSNEEVNSMKG